MQNTKYYEYLINIWWAKPVFDWYILILQDIPSLIIQLISVIVLEIGEWLCTNKGVFILYT